MVLCNLWANTFISEAIESDTKWTKNGSPYIIVNNITVKEGVTLVIEAGVKVLFSAETQITIDGTLRAQGNKKKKIIFTGKEETTSWNGFIFNRSCGQYNEENQEGSLFDFCAFKGMGEAPTHLIRSKGCNLRISNCSIEACYTAIQSERQAKVVVDKNSFKNCNRPLNVRNTSIAIVTDNKMETCNSIMLGGTTTFRGNILKNFSGKGRHSGIIVWMLGGGVVDIVNNQFLKFEDYVVKLQKMSRRSTLNLKNNSFKDNGTNLKFSCKYLSKGKTVVENNNFYNFIEYHIRLFSPCEEEENAALQIGANYWGKISEEELKAATFDQTKDESLSAKVTYEKPLLKAQ